MTSNDADLAALVERWCALDAEAALHAADREAVGASGSMRALVLQFARAGGADEEIFDACAALGRLFAQHRGSGTLAAATIDHAAMVLGDREAAWVAPGRAAVVEAFTATLLEEARQEALRGWEPPSCVVPLPDGSIAIAAGHPSADPEELSAWAARIAHEAALKGVRRAFIAGPPLARRAIEEALDLVGVAYDGSRT
ncbi:MAG TPA: hypothetical protein VHV30_12190 [Polyangiaceae bacterium]|jgi:hypothetical protein|nr:hypothetical protein [Polyangiaceae bacterium]